MATTRTATTGTSSRWRGVLSLAVALLALAASLQLIAAEETRKTPGQRQLLFSVDIPLAQGRCAGTFMREWLPCYVSQYSLFSSLG